MSSERLYVASREASAAEVVHRIVQSARAALDARDIFTIAIPGGSVAETCVPLLIMAGLPWEKVHVFWVDERAVPLTNRNSNAGQAFTLWEGTRFASEAHLHVMFGDPNSTRHHTTENSSASISATPNDAESAAAAYAAELASVAGTPVTLDVVLLGVGEDGHIASLFPNGATEDDSGRAVISVRNSPKPPADRLSLAFSVLTQAREVIVAAFGQAKAGVMQQALEDAGSNTPVARIIREAKQVHIMLDTEAAGELRNTTAASTGNILNKLRNTPAASTGNISDELRSTPAPSNNNVHE